MSIKAGVATSKDLDAYKAGFDACKSAIENAKLEQRPDLVIVFSSISLDQKSVLDGINKACDNAPLIGCSDAGEITNAGVFHKGVAVMVVSSDSVEFSLGVGREIQNGARDAGRLMFKDVMSKSQKSLRALLMFPDVLVGNGADIVRGVQDEAGKNFVVVGGASGDDFNFKQTYEYHNQEVISGGVTGVGLAGEFAMGIGVRHGWVPIGIPMKATKSEGAILSELDHKPAVSIYEDYFGQKANKLSEEPLARMAITYPLGVKMQGMDEYLIRDPITVNKDGSITCAAEIPQGSEIRLMIGSKDKAIDAARDGAKKVVSDLARLGSKPAFVLMFNCIAREKLFGQNANEEINAVLDIIGHDVPFLGFYTYGEIAPSLGEVHDKEKIFSRFYNETAVLFGVGEINK
jgi:hypothetical protein